MSDAKDRNKTSIDDDTIVEAAPDPTLEKIEQLQHSSDEDAEFARAEANFAVQEHEHARQLHEERRDNEANEYEHDAKERMKDATNVMKRSVEESAAADQLLHQQQQRLAMTLRTMSNHSIATLRGAVAEVYEYVQKLEPADRLRVSYATGLNEPQIETLRENIVETGMSIEQHLASVEAIRANPIQVVQEIVGFVVSVMTIADHVPALLDLVHKFGQLLLQFRLF